MARTLAHDACDLLDVAEQSLVGGVAGHVRDADGERDVLAGCPTQYAFPIPTLGQVGEQLRDGRRETEAPCQHPRRVAERGRVGPMRPRRPRQATRDLDRAAWTRAVRRGKRTHQRGERLARGAVQYRNEMSRVVATEDRRRDLAVGSTAGIRQ